MNTKTGKLLIASPQLTGTPFSRTVVFIIQDDANGSIGVVLNRAANEQMRNVWSEITDGLDGRLDRLSFGGPMSGPILAIHGVQQLGEMSPSENIFAAATQENLKELVSQSEAPYRIFFGLSAWRPGQLEEEIQQGAWLTMDADHSHVFHEHEDLWRDALCEVGYRTIERIVGKGRIPADSTLN